MIDLAPVVVGLNGVVSLVFIGVHDVGVQGERLEELY